MIALPLTKLDFISADLSSDLLLGLFDVEAVPVHGKPHRVYDQFEIHRVPSSPFTILEVLVEREVVVGESECGFGRNNDMSHIVFLASGKSHSHAEQ
jgi:hypothetical protein